MSHIIKDGHQGKYYSRTSTSSDVWLTPRYIYEPLGSFDLDPASPVNRPWDTASCHFTELDDGLSKDWRGRVWLNPPYGRQLPTWLERLANHGNGIALIFARTETKYFHNLVWKRADAVFFFKGRLHFCRPDGTQAGSASAPSCLVAYGQSNTEAIKNSRLPGYLVQLGGRQK